MTSIYRMGIILFYLADIYLFCVIIYCNINSMIEDLKELTKGLRRVKGELSGYNKKIPIHPKKTRKLLSFGVIIAQILI